MISIYSKNNTDFEHNGDAVLIPTSCKLSATINGAWQLTLEHPYDPEERYKYIVEGATIVADIRFIRELSTTRQKFRIYNYVKGLHSVTAIAFPVAMESTYDAPIDNLVISGKTGAQAMAQLQTKTNKYTLSSDITRTGSTSFSNTNINSAIASGDEGCFIDVWGGDILYDNLTFSVKNRLGDNVAADHPVIYGRNLTDIEYKKDDSGLTTRIYPISQDGIRLNGTGYVDSSRISDYPVPHSKFMTAPYSLIDTNAGSSTSTATKTQQAVSGVSTEASTTSQSVYATIKGNGYQPEYIKSIRNAIVEAVQTMALASVVSTSYYNLMANTIKSAMDWMGSLSQPKWEWMGSDQTGWKYGNASSYAKNMYVKIGKTWSYFGSDGNWQEPKDDSDEWDWHDAKGGTGKKYGNFTKYYAHNEYVYITVSGTIKEYWFNEQGWFEEDESGDSDYYWHGSGTGADPYWFGASSTDYLKSCWRFIDGTYYFFDSYGYVATQKDNYQWDWNDNGDSSRAWFGNAINSEYGSDGACLKSQWQKINGTWYYFDSNGLVVDEAVSQTQTVAAFTTGMASVKTTVDSWASQLYTLLYSLMTSYANKQFASGVDLPTITITVKMADLKKTTEYADYAHLEEIKLGDSVKCIDAVHDITTENRIIGITYDILRDYNESIVIGSASATVAQMVGNAGGEAAAQGFDTSALETQLTALRNGKQDKLTAGDNITIENNIISANAGGAGESTVYYGVGAPADTLGIDGDIYVEMAPASSGCADTITYIRSSNLSTISNTYADGFHKITGQWWTDRYEHTYTTYRIDGLTAGEEYDVILKVKVDNLVQEYESSSELFGIGIQNDSSWNAIANHVKNGEFAYYEDGNDKIYFQSLKPMTTKTQSYSFKFTAFSNNYILISPDAIVNDSTIPMEVEIAISDGTVGTDIVDVYYKIENEWLRYESDASYIAGANITITEVDGEKVISATDTTYSDFEGATSIDDGESGLVPAPEAGDEEKYLKGDGTWDEPEGTTVIANPTGTATANLSKLQVENTIYNIQGGGGGGNVDDVYVNGQSVVDANGIAQVKTHKQVTAGEYEDQNDDIIYFVEDDEELGVYYAPVIYSTTERKIGVWTDGKPLYQKTWVFSSTLSIGGNSWQTTNIAIADTKIELITKCKADNADGQIMNYISATSNLGAETYVMLYNSRTNASVDVKYLTLEYTKTTDTPTDAQYNALGVPMVHYTTDEQVIGTWVDGKPLYRKTVTYTGVSGARNSLDLNIANVDFINLVPEGSSADNRPLPYVTGTDNSNNIGGFFDVQTSTTTFKWRAGSGSTSSTDVILTVQYTKTTD